MHAFLESILQKIPSLKGNIRDRLTILGFPFENFQYVPLEELYQKKLEPACHVKISKNALLPAIFPECSESVLVFINGIFSKALSCTKAIPSSFLALPLSQAEEQFDSFVKGRIDILMREEKEPFPLLNYACFQEGVFLYLPPKMQLRTPLQILHVYDSAASLSAARVLFFMGKESQCDVYINEFFLEEPLGWSNDVLDIVQEEKSALNLYMLFKQAPSMVHTESLRVHLKKESKINLLSFGSGKQFLRQNFIVNAHRNAHADLKGAFLLDEKLETHIHTTVEHKEEAAHSLQKFKGILDGKSRMSFTGKIVVSKEAQHTQAYQLNNNLMLSGLARAYSKPNLEIKADDVKASHGATIGMLNEEDLFYLKSRGLTEAQARKLLIAGFYQEVLQQIPLQSAKLYAQIPR